jgi:hypothetical protein
MTTDAAFFSPVLSLSPSAAAVAEVARDLDADAGSESAARRGTLRGGDSDRGSSSSIPPKTDGDKAVKAFDEGRLSSVYTSTAAIVEADNGSALVVVCDELTDGSASELRNITIRAYQSRDLHVSAIH